MIIAAGKIRGSGMIRKSKRTSGPHSPDISPLAVKWMFAIMLDLGGHRQLILENGLNDDDVALELGIASLQQNFEEIMAGLGDDSPRKRSFKQKALARLKKERQLFDLAHPCPGYPDNLADNLDNLAQLIGLDEIDKTLLGFCVVLHTDAALDKAADQLGNIGFNRMLRTLSTLLQVPMDTLRLRLTDNGLLVRAGLIQVGVTRGMYGGLDERLKPKNSDLLHTLRHHHGSALELFKSAFRPASAGTLTSTDFPHLHTALSIAKPYLQNALSSGTQGVNILIYGPPGTGKSQLTRLLADELGTALFEVACTDSSGNPIDRLGRLCALRSAMCVLHQQHTLLVLDEIEDLFNDSSEMPFLTATSSKQKGWINRMLEENPLPCFWLTNNIGALDNAYIRRFDLVLELNNPPRAQRERIIRQSSGKHISPALADKLASHEQMTPAVITRALRIAEALEDAPGAPSLDSTIEYLVDATLSAQGFDKLGRNHYPHLPDFYSPQLVNADIELESLLEGLREHPEARLCFYGPPGTGKTAYGHWLARELGKPLVVRRVSDLISPYLGMTEKNLANAFNSARDDDAVLLLDEVDSFLQDRRKAKHSWEITAVNEMLTQMESYRGLMIAATNLMEDLDQASLRRFDLKICFGYLYPEQAAELFRQHLKQLGLAPATSKHERDLRRLGRLTPGDFATVARRSRFKPFADAGELFEALRSECTHKESAPTNPIGFVH
jgi:transitional endoplasmic reticulum ATPase